MPVICPSCQSENEPGRKFCAECGARLTVVCPSCGTANTPGAKFCGECGSTLAASAAPAATGAAPTPPPTAPTAERRLVSVLFADLVGFTTLAEHRDPEETREILNRYFETARTVIDRYGGVVEKFIGDAVMAVWGTPTAHEDDAERAVRAALELVDAVQALETASDATLSARAGVLTGEAAVTIGASGQGMVAGDLVNTASRLQSVASPGSVLVGDATRHAAAEAIDFEPVEPQQLKGKQLPIAAWRALRVVAQRGGAGRADVLEAPFVGRDDELRLLRELLHATGREQRPRLVSVTGTAGIGKSRLAWELLKYVDGVVEDIYWHEGRSPAYGEGITFWALGEMVRRRAQIAEGEPPDESRAKLAATVAEYVPDESERPWIEPRLAGLLGLAEMPPGEREELFAAWRTFFQRVAERGTALLVFEDLHWADTGLLDFIEHLLEWARSSPILVVTLARPELLDRRRDWGLHVRNFAAIHLDPLPSDAMTALVAGIVPGIPDTLTARIVERAEGVPLYAVELVRMLLADGRLAHEDDGYRYIGDLERLEVPDSLQALLAARLDGLERQDRALLQSAAVLGLTFTPQALRAVSGADEEAVDAALRRMVRSELLTVDADPRSPERGQYRFLQGLTREVAYGMLARPERRARHVAAARYFEQLGDDELAGVLASHYLDAYRAAQPGPEADALAAQARVALRGAAERAAALQSHRQAIAYVELALPVTTDERERAQLWERAADSASSAADVDEAQEYSRHALDAYRRLGDEEAIARSVARLGRNLQFGGRVDLAVDELERELARHPDADRDPRYAPILSELARVKMLGGESPTDLQRAVDLAERALVVGERHDLVGVVIDALITRGTALGGIGRPREGTALLRAAADMASVEGLMTARFRAIGNLSFLQARDDPRAALATTETGLSEARRLGEPGWAAFLGGNMVDSLFDLGRWDELLAAADELLEELGPGPHTIGIQANIAKVAAFRGDEAAARRFLASADAASGEVRDPQVLQNRSIFIALLDMTAGRLEEAYASAMRAAAMTTANAFSAYWVGSRAAFWLGDRSGLAAAASGFAAASDRGRVVEGIGREIEAGELALSGQRAAAAAAFRDVVRRWHDLEMLRDEAMALLALAATLGGSGPEAQASVADARKIGERLGMTGVLAHAEARLPSVARFAAAAEGRPAAPATVTDGSAMSGSNR